MLTFKKTTCILLMFIMLMPYFNMYSLADSMLVTEIDETMSEKFLGGDGTENNPYQVSTPQQLDAVRNNLSAYYVLTNDIDLNDWGNWEPIGVGDSMSGSASPSNAPRSDYQPFTGNFDGGNYTIRNLKINDHKVSYISDCYGLFSAVDGATIQNLILEDVNILIDKTTTDYVLLWEEYLTTYSVIVGAVAGYSYDSTITNCDVTGNISVIHCSDASVGGIVGYGNASECINRANVYVYADKDSRYEKDSTVTCGGITGESYTVNGVINKNTNYGDIDVNAGHFAYVGGISGEYGKISDCVNFGNINGKVLKAGSHSSFAGVCNVGGIVGATSSDYVKKSVNYGCISAYLDCSESSNYANSSCYAYAGGVVGFCGYYGSGLISQCYNLSQSVSCIKISNTGKVLTQNAGRISGCSIKNSECFSVTETSVNNTTISSSLNTSNDGQDIVKEACLIEETYIGFDFKSVWKIDKTIGGAVLDVNITGLMVYSDYQNLSFRKGSYLYLGVAAYIKGVQQTDLSGITFTVSDPSVIEPVKTVNKDNCYFVRLKGVGTGNASVSFSDSLTGYSVKVPVTVYDNNTMSYTLNNVPTQEIDKYETNFYNYNGLFIDNYDYTINDDRSATVTFDVYNTAYSYGIVESCDKNNKIYQAVLIDKYNFNNGSIKESVWDNTCCLVRDFIDGDFLTYRQESGYSIKTPVEITVPEGGYIYITMSSRESNILAVVNSIDLLMGIKDLTGDISDFDTSSKEYSQKLTAKLVSDTAYVKLMSSGSEFSENLFKNVGKQTFFNTKSLGSFADTIVYNISEINLGELVSSTALDFGWSIGEDLFTEFAGPAGKVLEGLFTFGDTCNLVSQGNDFCRYIDTYGIVIANQGGGVRNANEVKIESDVDFDNDMALNTYKFELDNQVLSILKEKSPDVYNQIRGGLERTYNISLVKNGVEAQHSDSVRVYIPLTSEMKLLSHIANIKVYRIEEDGTTTEIECSVDNGMLSFETNHFSIYSIVCYDESTESSICDPLDYEYEILEDSNISLIKYNGTDAYIKIPSAIDGYVISGISGGCFENNTVIENVIIPDSVKTICDNAFASCTKLVSVEIYEFVTSIGDSAFADCNNFTISCYKGSIAESYAVDNSISYKYLCSNITINNYEVIIDHADQINHIRFASGEHTTVSSIKNASDRVDLSASVIAKNTIDGKFVYTMPDGGYYTFWVRMTDGAEYFLTADMTEFTPTVDTYGVKINVNNLYDVKDVFIAKGEFDTYNEIKTNGYIVRLTASKIDGKHNYTYTVTDPGMHTVLVRYNDGREFIFHEELAVDNPVFTTNGLQVTISNIPDVKVIRTAYGEYYTPGDTKRAAGARNFSNKAVIKDEEEYMLQYREEGRVTIIVEYNNGYVKVFHYDVTKKVPTVEHERNNVTFGDLDGLVMIRYAEGEYATSSEIKKAPDSKVIKPDAIVDGKISVTLEAGTYTFSVQFDDESYNYYKVVIE
ncbi:MAG: leucine-rich repeat protein [Clostridia bacterium]|nr:leucine-rich repeat protein [Clostridia bacterium]